MFMVDLVCLIGAMFCGKSGHEKCRSNSLLPFTAEK
jgi:hypothetical protein